MKYLPGLFILAFLSPFASAADPSAPIVSVERIFAEQGGFVEVEAEQFYKQTLTDSRRWYITHDEQEPLLEPDGDPSHPAGASGGAYIEILPDTRRKQGDELVQGENFSNEAGKLAVLHYRVNITSPGRYYVWVSAFSTGTEDNGIHVGINGEWPESGQRMQWCKGKNRWRWESRQRTKEQHCGEPYSIYLDIDEPGVHDIQFSMREDGFEFDRFVLSQQRELPASLTEPFYADRGFTALFNGRDFEGWNIKIRSDDQSLVDRVFTVDEGGLIHIFRDLPDGHELNTGKNPTHGLMYTEKSYSRFIFRFEYKWGEKRYNNFDKFQYDAGMYYHVFDDRIWPKGIEYQVRYNHVTEENHTGDFWASGTRFQWFADENNRFLPPAEGGKPQEQRGGEHRARPDVAFHALDGGWNRCEVIVMGNKYAIHKLNGKVVNMATDLSQSEGIIGLQSETAEIYYRNIEIREFDEDVPLEKFIK